MLGKIDAAFPGEQTQVADVSTADQSDPPTANGGVHGGVGDGQHVLVVDKQVVAAFL